MLCSIATKYGWNAVRQRKSVFGLFAWLANNKVCVLVLLLLLRQYVDCNWFSAFYKRLILWLKYFNYMHLAVNLLTAHKLCVFIHSFNFFMCLARHGITYYEKNCDDKLTNNCRRQSENALNASQRVPFLCDFATKYYNLS